MVQKYLAGTVSLCYYPVAQKQRFCQPINGHCVSLELVGSGLAPFQGLSGPTEEYCETGAAQSGLRQLFGSGNLTRTAPLQTEPTRTLQWKCGITAI